MIPPNSHALRRLFCLRLAFSVLLVAGLVLSLNAQTAFIGSWKEAGEGWVFGEAYNVYDNEPNLNSEFYIVEGPLSELVVTMGTEPYTREYWRVTPIVAQGTFRATYSDNHWNNPNAWSAGMPDANTEARIIDSKTIVMPGPTETAGAARSLTMFATMMDGAGNYVVQNVTLSGNLNLTPLAFNESLRVGVASAAAKARTTNLTLSGATLNSGGIAKIGVGLPSGAGGTLTGHLLMDDNSQWFHPAGLIELGGGDGVGRLDINTGSVLAGSFLPGAQPGPRVVIRPGSSFQIIGGSARLSELSINSGNSLTSDHGLLVSSTGSLETGSLVVGETTQAYAIFDTASATLGAVTVGQDSVLDITDSNTTADSLAITHGKVQLSSNNTLTIGDPEVSAGSTNLLVLATASGSTARLWVAGNDGDTGTLTVHGSALIGGFGTANVQVSAYATLDIRGDATLGTSESSEGGAAGNGTVTVSGVFRTQKIEVGYSYFDSYSYNPYPSPTGRLTIGAFGRVEVAGRLEAGQSLEPDGEGNYAFGEIHYPGSITVGKNGTIDLDATGKLVFTDPTGGTAVRYIGTPELSNFGLITGGGTSAPAPGNGAHIDFGSVEGLLQNFGHISPGHSAGWLTVNGSLTFADSFGMTSPGRLLIELGGTTAGFGYDVLEVWGNADLTGAVLEFSLISGYAPQQGDAFTFLLVGGDLTGMFDSLVDHTGLGLSLDHISIVDGSVILTMPVSAVPEPSVAALVAGLMALGWAVRACRRSR